MTERILVIKLSALGDFLLSLGAMEAIRKHHPAAHITLLTRPLFKDMAVRSGYFDDVVIDPKPAFYELEKWWELYRFFNKGYFTRVYDLQMNDRTNFYYKMFREKPAWSGTAKGASHPFADPDRHGRHAYENHKIRLGALGIEVTLPELSWMNVDASHFGLQKPYVLLVPGSAPQHPQKRWPAIKYGALSMRLMREGYDVAVLGTDAERDVVQRVIKSAPHTKDLSGMTSFYDIATLAKDAAGAVGNDTGPMHLISLAGCPVTVLFSGTTDPARSAPVGPAVTVIQSENIIDITLDDVLKSFRQQAAA